MHTYVRPLPRILIIAGFAALTASAQTATAPEGAATRISPFEVVTQQDESFTTSAVGTGSRLKLDLKDVPAAYSVINRSFIDALGITDMAEAASWAPGQTFQTRDGDRAIFGEQNSFVSRGFTTTPGGANVNASAGNGSMRNFYSNSTQATDSYMVESFDFGRGPNSSLFGTSQSLVGGNISAGSGFAGVNSSRTKRSRFDRTTTSITLERGSWGVQRQTLDHNRPLAPNLGLRVNLVNNDSPNYFRSYLATTRGIHITMTAQFGARTSFTVEGSHDKVASHNLGRAITENVSGWDGRTVFRGPILNSMISTNQVPGATSATHAQYGTIQVLGGSALTFNGEPQGVSRIGGASQRFDPDYNTIMNWQNFATTRSADSTTRTPIYTKTSPTGQFSRISGTALTNATATTITGPFTGTNTPVAFGYDNGPANWWTMDGIPRDMFDRVQQNSHFRLPADDRDNWASVWPQNIQWAKDLQFTLTHSITPDFTAEIGGDINRIYTENWKNNAQNTFELDVNTILPNGQPNPHFLDTYNTVEINLENQKVAEQTIRMNLGYTKNLGRWGRYTFNVNGNAQTRFFEGDAFRTSLALPTTDPRRWSGTDRVQYMTYYRSSRNFEDVRDGRTIDFTNVVWDTNNQNPVIQPTVKVQPKLVRRGVQTEADTHYLSQYLLLQSNASYFNNRLVLLGSIRRDYSKTFRTVGIDSGDLPADWDAAARIFKPMWTGLAASTHQGVALGTATDFYRLTYQPLSTVTGLPIGERRIAASRPRITDPLPPGLSIPNPLYSGVRPPGYTGLVGPYQAFRNDFNAPVSREWANTFSLGMTARPLPYLSPYFNYSNQTIPTTTAELDLEQKQKKIVTAHGIDFGTRFDIGTKFNSKYNYFINERENETTSNNVISNINTLINANKWDNTVDGDVNDRGILPLPGNPDYQNAKNLGYEVELSGEPLRGLRLSVNGSISMTLEDQADRYPLTRKYMVDPVNIQMMRDLLEDAGGSIDPTTKQIFDNAPVDQSPGLARAIPLPGSAIGVDTTSAVNAYNNTWISYATILDENASSRSRSAKSANFFADYTIPAGFARGFRIGLGYQWQGDRQLGNRGGETIIDPANPNRAIDDPRYTNQDILWGRGARQTQANLSYPFTFKNGNTLRMALRINNPLNDRRIDASWALRQPEGDLTKPNRVLMPAGVSRWNNPINYRLTATYTFSGGTSSR